MKPLLEIILPLLLEAWVSRVTMASECSSSLGMEIGTIIDDQLSASSSWSETYLPHEARLNGDEAWYPKHYNNPSAGASEWLQIDLVNRKQITGIQTQGHVFSIFTSYYVRSFKILFSDNEEQWAVFQDGGSDKIFDGNINGNGIKSNDIDPPIVARFIRLMAVTWRNGIAFRLELLGCELPTTTSEMTTAVEVQTTRSTQVNTYSRSSTNPPTVSTEGVTPAVLQKSTSPVSSLSGSTPSPSSNNTIGYSDGLAGNQAGTTSGAMIGGAVAAGVVVLIIAIVVSIFFVRRRRSKATDEKESPSQPDETGTVDNIYYGGVRFAANGNASTNGNVSIGQSEGMVDNDLYAYAGTTNGDVTIDQSEGMVDNHIYAGTNNDNAAIDQSEGTVDNNLYAGTGNACAETSHHGADDSTQDNVYYNMAHTPDEGTVENDIYC